MGWLRLVGSLKLYVSFAEYRLFYRSLLQKRPIILMSLLIVATPYHTANPRKNARNTYQWVESSESQHSSKCEARESSESRLSSESQHSAHSSALLLSQEGWRCGGHVNYYSDGGVAVMPITTPYRSGNWRSCQLPLRIGVVIDMTATPPTLLRK